MALPDRKRIMRASGMARHPAGQGRKKLRQ
jgi:hypothetical protein